MTEPTREELERAGLMEGPNYRDFPPEDAIILNDCPEGCDGSRCHCQSCGETGVPLNRDGYCQTCAE